MLVKITDFIRVSGKKDIGESEEMDPRAQPRASGVHAHWWAQQNLQAPALHRGHLKINTCWAVWLLLRDQLLKTECRVRRIPDKSSSFLNAHPPETNSTSSLG